MINEWDGKRGNQVMSMVENSANAITGNMWKRVKMICQKQSKEKNSYW